MQLHSDISIRHVVDLNIPFIASSIHDVQRRMLDRTGDEVARAKTIVTNSSFVRFPRHTHGDEEEFVTLDEVFSDDRSGDHSRFSYCRHETNTKHES